MRAAFPTHAVRCVLYQLLLVACARGLRSNAYSEAPRVRPLASIAPDADARGTPRARRSAPGDRNPPFALRSDATAGRRVFLQRSAAALTSATAAMASSAILSPPAEAASPTPSLGAPAPEFSLVNTRGKTVTLDSLSADGKWTVLYFYPGAFTSGCTIEARKFQEDLPKFLEANAQIVGVSVDSVAKNAEFCSSEGLGFFMLTDEGGKVSKAYGSSLSIPGFGTFSNRQTYIIDPEKNVRWVFVDVESHIPKHSGEVLEKLKMLQQA